ncbi:MAG TPA: carboxypeptidase regulatory-like domain-containing protein [Pyrinomonadaceae bacterium]
MIPAKLIKFAKTQSLGVALLIVATSLLAIAQTTTGTLRGTVTDTNGAVVAGAAVSATNQATKTAVVFTTTSEGIYVIPNLVPGQYTIAVESAGFKKAEIKNSVVRLDQNTLNITLEPGNVAETVTVVAGGQDVVINRDQSQLSASIDTKRVQDLPSNAAGDGLDTLALLIPGVVPGSQTGTNSNGERLSVNGNRPRANNFQIDGSDNNDLVIGGPSLFVSNQDQVQEFQIITNNFSAQYGRNQGAVVNIVTKSGGNEFHGTASEYFRDQKHLDSLTNVERRNADPKDPSTLNPAPLLSHVFGGTIGGPIIKNRAFFFGSYQGQRQSSETLEQSAQAAVGPTMAIVPGEFARLTSTFPGNPVIDAIVKYSPFAISAGNPRPSASSEAVQTVCLATGPTRIVTCGTAGAQGPFKLGGPFDVFNFAGTLFQSAFFDRSVSTPASGDEYSIRGDLKITDNDSANVRYFYQKGDAVNGLALANFNGFNGDVPFVTRNLTGAYVRQFSSSIVNDLRGTYQKLFVHFGSGCDISTPGCIGDPDDIEKSQADILFTGVTGFANPGANLANIGPGGSLFGFPQGRDTTVYQLADNLTVTRGRHSLTVGGEFKYTKSDNPFLPTYQGRYTFNSGTRILNNAPSAYALTVGNFSTTFDQYDQYYFIQDDWKARKNFTLNLGLRYEYYGAPIDDLNDLTVARESGSSPLFNPALPLSVRTVPRVPPDKNNFAPRFGFAYTPNFWKSLFGEDATVFRGGYSIAYETPFYNLFTNVAGSSPTVASISFATGSPFLPATGSPLPLPMDFRGDVVRQQAASAGVVPIGRLDPRLLSQTTVSSNFHSPYSQQWSFGMQRQLGRNAIVEVNYVGNHGVGLFQNQSPNPVIRNLALGFSFDFGPPVGVINFPAFPEFVPAGVTPQVCVNNPATPDNEGACNRRVLAGRGAITERANSAQSNYNGLQTRFNGRFLQSALVVGAAFTWSKTIDNASEAYTYAEGSSFAPNPFNTSRSERSYSALDRPAAFSGNFTYDVPLFKEQRGFVGRLLGGFQLNGTYVLVSGRRYTPSGLFYSSALGNALTYEPSTGNALRPFIGNTTVDPRLVGISQLDAALLFGYTPTNVNGFWSLNEINSTGNLVEVTPKDVRFIFNGPGAARIFHNPFGDTPRNYLQGPALNQLNLGIFKTTRIAENIKLQFRAELYNALNHPSAGYGITNFTGISYTVPSIYVENAGASGTAFADKNDMNLNRRVIQFGLRLIF